MLKTGREEAKSHNKLPAFQTSLNSDFWNFVSLPILATPTWLRLENDTVCSTWAAGVKKRWPDGNCPRSWTTRSLPSIGSQNGPPIPQILDRRAAAAVLGGDGSSGKTQAQARWVPSEGGRVCRAFGSPKFFVYRWGAGDSHIIAGRSTCLC